MTKREICERLMEIRDYSRIAHGGGIADQTLDDMLEQIAADLKHLLLDLTAPEAANPFKGMSVADLAANTEWLRTPYLKPETEEPEAEGKHPGVIAKPKGKNPPESLARAHIASIAPRENDL